MALIECPECGREISEHAEACPHCGAPARLWEDMEIAGSDAEGREPEPTPAEDLGEDEKTTLEKVADALPEPKISSYFVIFGIILLAMATVAFFKGWWQQLASGDASMLLLIPVAIVFIGIVVLCLHLGRNDMP